MLDFNLLYEPDMDFPIFDSDAICVESKDSASRSKGDKGCTFPAVLSLESLLRETDARLSDYRDGWAGQDSHQVSEKALGFYRRFLRRVFSENPDTPLPHIGLEHDGSIGMFWKEGSVLIDVEVDDGGAFAYAAMRDDNHISSGEDIEADDMTEILNHLLVEA